MSFSELISSLETIFDETSDAEAYCKEQNLLPVINAKLPIAVIAKANKTYFLKRIKHKILLWWVKDVENFPELPYFQWEIVIFFNNMFCCFAKSTL